MPGGCPGASLDDHLEAELLQRRHAGRDEGDAKLAGVKVENVKTGEASELPVTGVFIAIGHRPGTDLYKGQLAMKENGYLVTEPGRTATDVEGVFAVGDVTDDYYRQAITASGSGCQGALEAERYLESLHD